MKYIEKLLAFFLLNGLVLYLINIWVPDLLVFGRLEIGYWQALATTAFGIALAALIVDLAYQDFGIKLNAQKYMTVEFLVNIGALYLLAHTPLQNSVGVGIAAYWVSIMTGAALSVAQYALRRSQNKML